MKPKANRGRRTKADFRFQNARLSFSFAGTLGDRGRLEPYERLRSPADLSRWCVESGCVVTAPHCSAADLTRAKQLRETIQRAGECLAVGRAVSSSDVKIINRIAARPPLAPELVAGAAKVRWVGSGLEAVLSTVARDLIAICDSPLKDRVRICENEECGVPFVDTSRAGIRRWCSMSTCGALIKKRAYRERLKEESRG